MKSVFYINLINRTDRKTLIENELSKYFENITRVDAENGLSVCDDTRISSMIGCGLSHIKALKLGIESESEYVYIFEDDFQFEMDYNDTKNILEKIETKDFNLMLLTYHYPFVKINNINDNVFDISNAQTTCGYVIKKSFIPILIKNLEESINNLISSKDLSKYSLDQYWKVLQTPENKVFGITPRLGKQRDNFSDIEKSNVSYGGSCFMGIISCKKYFNRIKEQDLSSSIFQYKYFIGDPSLEHPLLDGNIVYLPCGDNYEDLTIKVQKMMEWIINNYPHIDYVFKTDDDIRFDFIKLSEIYSNICARNINFGGQLVRVGKHVSTYHYDKCSDTSLEFPVKMEETTYCCGGGYFLSKKSVNVLLNNIDKYKNIFEDYSIGRTLTSCGISPINLNLKGVACFW